MFHIRKEGGIMRQGFNFYPLSDTHSAGFILRIGRRDFWVRYSKKSKTWILG